MTALPLTGTLTRVGSSNIGVEHLDLAEGGRSVLLSISSRDGSEAEVLLSPEEAQGIAQDLIVFARSCQQHNQGGRQ